jgi:hypothetical protein
MYTSFSTLQTNTNYNQPLAHPLGANFYETIGVIRFQPTTRLNMQLKGVYYAIGYDSVGSKTSNVGQNIQASYNNRSLGDYGNTISQGQLKKVLFLDYMASYMFKHNLFFDLGFTYRYANSAIKEYQTENLYLNIAIRLNMARREIDR